MIIPMMTRTTTPVKAALSQIGIKTVIATVRTTMPHATMMAGIVVHCLAGSITVLKTLAALQGMSFTFHNI